VSRGGNKVAYTSAFLLFAVLPTGIIKMCGFAVIRLAHLSSCMVLRFGDKQFADL
jgi:hypothetical protein